MKLIKEKTAACLPAAWDRLCGDNPYLRRDFLSFIEKTEQYDPTYWLFCDGDAPDSCFVSFQRRDYNLAMFTRFRFPIAVTLIYLPMSISREGIVLGRFRDEVLAEIRKIKGFKMILNLDQPAAGFVSGLTCPKCILDLRWDTFDGYLASLRSGYRRRIRQSLRASKELTLRFIDNQKEFSEALYALYLSVQNRSHIKIETLSRTYFTGEMFRVFVMEREGEPLGFVQLLENGTELIFEFVGIRYDENDRYDTYQRMLAEIIRYGIEHGFRTIDFGQTADDAKRKLGCRYVPLYASLHHHNRFVNAVFQRLAHFIEYKPLTTEFRVFNEQEG